MRLEELAAFHDLLVNKISFAKREVELSIPNSCRIE